MCIGSFFLIIEIPSDAILANAGVQSLYADIQLNTGLEALIIMYEKYDVSMPFEESIGAVGCWNHTTIFV